METPSRRRLLIACAIALVIVAGLVTAVAVYRLDPVRQYMDDSGHIVLHGTISGALLNYLQHGPSGNGGQPAPYVLYDDGYPTAMPRYTPYGATPQGRAAASVDVVGAIRYAGEKIIGAVQVVADAFAYTVGHAASAISGFFVMDAQATGCTGTGNCYWKSAGDANWSTTADWFTATNGGGTSGGLPSATDVVNFDANSGGHKTTLDGATTVGGMVMTGFTGTLDTSAASHFQLTVNGSWTAPAGTTLNLNSSLIVINGTTNWNGVTLNAGTSTVQFSSSVTYTPSGGLALYDVIIDASKNVTTATNTFNWNDVLTVNGTLTLGAPGAVCRDSTGVSAPLVMGGSGSITSGYAPITWGAVAGTLIIIPGGTYTGIAYQFQPTVVVAGQGFEFRLGGDTTLTEIDFRPSTSVPFFLNSQTHNVTVTAASATVNDLTLGNPGAAGYGIKATSGTWSLAGPFAINDGANSAKFYMQLGSTSWTVSGAWDDSSTTNSTDWQVGTSTITFNSTSGQTMKFANLGAAEFYNVTFNSGANTVSQTMSTNGLVWTHTLTVAGGAGVTTLATANLGLTGGDVSIGNAGVLTANASTVSVGAVTMTGGSTGTITVTTGAWTITGNWDTHGVGSTFAAGTTATYSFNGTLAITLLSTQDTFPNFTVAGGTVTQSSTIVVTNTISVTGGTYAMGSQAITAAAITANGGSTTAAGATVVLSGALTISNAASSVGLGTASSWSVASVSISNGFATQVSGTFTSSGNVAISAAAAYLVLGSSTWNVGGTWTNSSTSASWNPGTSTVTFDATAAKAITPGNMAGSEFYNVTFNSGANTVTYTLGTRGLKWGGQLNVTGGAGVTTLATANLTLQGGQVVVGNAGVLTANTSSVTTTGVTMTGGVSGTITLSSGSWSVSGTWDTSGAGSTFTQGTSTVTMNGLGAIKLLAGQTFHALDLNGSGTVNAQSAIVCDSLLITGEELALAGQTLTVNGNVTMQTSGDIRAGTGAVLITGNLDVSDATSYLIMGSVTWTINGTWSNASTSSSWSAGTSTVVLNNVVAMNIATSPGMTPAEFYNLTLGSTAAGSITYTITHALVVANTLNISDAAGGTVLDVSAGNLAITAKNVTVATTGSLKLRASTITVTGNWNDTGSVAWTASAWTLALTGATAQSIAALHALPTVTMAGAGTKTFTANFTTGNVTEAAASTWAISPGVTYTVVAGSTIKVSGSLSWAGTAGHAVTITSTGAWGFDTNARAITVSGVSVRNSRVAAGYQVYDCSGGTDLGGNDGWVFPGGACSVPQLVNNTLPQIGFVILALIPLIAVIGVFVFLYSGLRRTTSHVDPTQKGKKE